MNTTTDQVIGYGPINTSPIIARKDLHTTVQAMREERAAELAKATTDHRTYIDSLTEAQGGEQEMRKYASWGERADETGFDVGRN